MDRRFFGAMVGCLMIAGCPSNDLLGDTDNDSEGDSEDTTGTPPATTVPATMSASSSMSGTTTTGPTTGSDTDSQSEAESMPTVTGDPDEMGCCEPHGTPNCDEPAVQECVCTELPECCVFEWDQNCVDVAMGDCDATCMPGETDSTTTGPSGCDLEQIELTSEDAALSGSWTTTTSMTGEGEVVFIPFPSEDGEVVWTVPVPCEDDWFIWVRSFDSGTADTFFVTLDGEPADPPVIYENDCTDGPNPGAYRWTLLNRRAEDAPICEYEEDPWIAEWDEGDHDVAFSFRESRALGRIIATNDPDFDPEAR